MAAPYDLDLRKKAMELVEKGMSKKKVSDLLGIGVASVFRWIRRAKEGRALKTSRPKVVIKKIDPEVIRTYLEKKPHATYFEMKKDLGFSIRGLWYRVKQLGITLKKKSSSTKKPIKRIEKPLEEG